MFCFVRNTISFQVKKKRDEEKYENKEEQKSKVLCRSVSVKHIATCNYLENILASYLRVYLVNHMSF